MICIVVHDNTFRLLVTKSSWLPEFVACSRQSAVIAFTISWSSLLISGATLQLHLQLAEIIVIASVICGIFVMGSFCEFVSIIAIAYCVCPLWRLSWLKVHGPSLVGHLECICNFLEFAAEYNRSIAATLVTGWAHCNCFFDIRSALQSLLQIFKVIALTFASLQAALHLLFCKFASFIAIALAIDGGALWPFSWAHSLQYAGGSLRLP